ncbi:hypothetical protein A3A66_01210 [Microgenomates group bacterium RIFCSPLOWO2_01_FULL_46_13]|nr:MAG: hypothetical protein A2783_02485 [Microgenomates group bacterium RIFCSPHIGHO2_01_FULL_45_11]OGV94621.1 MAG: hypothetical protein A3A66_01210 [Microgenomates group bacterium RIFCSPLOWO2_01_FULL_46_13]
MGHRVGFGFAINGIRYAFSSQPNFIIHLAVVFLVVILGWFLKVSATDWVVLTLTMVIVLVAEMINTALEAMTDLISKEYRQEAKIAKDVAAGMVLTASLGAVVVGIVIFVPYIFEFLTGN